MVLEFSGNMVAMLQILAFFGCIFIAVCASICLPHPERKVVSDSDPLRMSVKEYENLNRARYSQGET